MLRFRSRSNKKCYQELYNNEIPFEEKYLFLCKLFENLIPLDEAKKIGESLFKEILQHENILLENKNAVLLILFKNKLLASNHIFSDAIDTLKMQVDAKKLFLSIYFSDQEKSIEWLEHLNTVFTNHKLNIDKECREFLKHANQSYIKHNYHFSKNEIIEENDMIENIEKEIMNNQKNTPIKFFTENKNPIKTIPSFRQDIENIIGLRSS